MRSNALDNTIEACARFVTDDTKIITFKCDVEQGATDSCFQS